MLVAGILVSCSRPTHSTWAPQPQTYLYQRSSSPDRSSTCAWPSMFICAPHVFAYAHLSDLSYPKKGENLGDLLSGNDEIFFGNRTRSH